MDSCAVHTQHGPLMAGVQTLVHKLEQIDADKAAGSEQEEDDVAADAVVSTKRFKVAEGSSASTGSASSSAPWSSSSWWYQDPSWQWQERTEVQDLAFAKKHVYNMQFCNS
jgi:hypothetical protein